jgi:glycerol-3-phosphate dehydrogenase (NAD+)
LRCENSAWNSSRVQRQRRTSHIVHNADHSTDFSSFSNESAGIADLITTCYGGRNRKCAEEFVKSGKPFPEIEAKLLNGQKLQGTATAEEVHNFLLARKRVKAYPLFEKVYKIAFEGLSPDQLVKGL